MKAFTPTYLYIKWHTVTGLLYLGKTTGTEKCICPHCKKEGGIKIMPRYHFDNCKHKLSEKGVSPWQ